MNIITTIFLAVFLLVLVVLVDLSLNNLSKKKYFHLFTKQWVRMFFSYIIGISIFLLVMKIITMNLIETNYL